MKKIKVLIFLIVFSISIPSIGQSWTKIEGRIYHDDPTDMEIGNDNNTYTIKDPFEFNKVDSIGNLLWSWKPIFFNNSQILVKDISVSNDIFITGWLTGSVKIGDSVYSSSKNSFKEFFISKFNESKKPLWTIRAKSADTIANQETSSGGLSVKVSKKNKLYALVDIGKPVVIGGDTIFNNDYDSTYYVSHNYLIKMDTSGGIEWSREYDCHFIEVDTSDNYYTIQSNIVKKYDNDANLLWQRTFNSSVSQIELDKWNNLYTITDSTLHKVNITNGHDEWETNISMYGSYEISSNSLGMVLVSGIKSTTNSNKPPVNKSSTYFEYFDKLGHKMGFLRWAIPKGNGHSYPKAIQLQKNSKIYVYGQIFSIDKDTFEFGKETLSNIGNTDTYLSSIPLDDWVIIGLRNNIEDDKFNYLVYPNPTSDILVIEHIDFHSSKLETSLCDFLGREVQTNIIKGYITKLNLSQLDPGLYILKIKNKSGTLAFKILKK
ncbi:MAG TPA: T9SS type A sorting domain-containing protein [Cytophagaceae bacterium]|jgi:hypothetical protein